MRYQSRLLIAVALVAGLLVPAAARPDGVAARSCWPCPATTTADLNLRAGPSLADEVYLVIPAGAAVEWDPMQGEIAGFVAVTYDGVSGWAHRDYLRRYPGFATTTDGLNLRSDPSLDAGVILVMPAGSQVTTLGGQTNGFFLVEYGSTIGWAHGDYLSFDEGGPGNDGFPIGEMVVVVDGPLNYRTDPALGAGVLEVLPTGTEGAILDGPVYADGWTWYQIGLPGYGPDGETPGWAAGEFLGRV